MSNTSAEQFSTDESLQQLDPSQLTKLQEYIEILLRNNQLFNLTAISDRTLAWNRHVVESLRLLPLLGPGRRLIDVGSGGGLPGLVIAIARPDLSVTLLEATGKKARFLQQTGHDLRLGNLSVICDRAETAAKPGGPHRESFDIVTARALAPMRILVELAAPFARVGGLIVAVKGEKSADELAAAANALWSLHVEAETTIRHPTASVVLLRKRAATPTKYPRRPGEPKRNPL